MKTSYEYILIYDISCKTLIGASTFCIWFDKEDGFIRVYGRTRYVVLFSNYCYNIFLEKCLYQLKNKFLYKL